MNFEKHLGVQGMLRASHLVRVILCASEDEIPAHDQRSRDAIPPGKIVELLIPIWLLAWFMKLSKELCSRFRVMMSLPEGEALRHTERRDEKQGPHIEMGSMGAACIFREFCSSRDEQDRFLLALSISVNDNQSPCGTLTPIRDGEFFMSAHTSITRVFDHWG